MRLVEFYKELQIIIESFHYGELDEVHASNLIENLKLRAVEGGLEVLVKPDILKKIELYEEESSYSYEEDEDEN
jgi:hypothetical protein